jgi:hypothetical protein
MGLGMSKDNKRILMTPTGTGAQVAFAVTDVSHVCREVLMEAGGLDRLRLFFRRPLKLPNGDQTHTLIINFEFDHVGLTAEQKDMLQGASKRPREEEEAVESPKRAKSLSGRPSRRAKSRAKMIMGDPMEHMAQAAITPEMRIKMKTVSDILDMYVKGFKATCPDATFSTLTIDKYQSNGIMVLLDGVTQQGDDPLHLYSTDEGMCLLLTCRYSVNKFQITIFRDELDFVMLVAEPEDAEEEEEDDELPVLGTSTDDLDRPDHTNFVVFMRANEIGGVSHIKIAVPYVHQLIQVREWLQANNIPYFSCMANAKAVDKIDMLKLCNEQPREFDVSDTNHVIGGVLDGFRAFEPQVGNDDDSDPEEIEYEDDEDELDDLEKEVSAEDRLNEMLVAARRVAKLGKKESLVDDFEELPDDQQTEQKLKEMFDGAGLLGFLLARLGEDGFSISSSESESDSDADEWGSDAEEEEEVPVVESQTTLPALSLPVPAAPEEEEKKPDLAKLLAEG